MPASDERPGLERCRNAPRFDNLHFDFSGQVFMSRSILSIAADAFAVDVSLLSPDSTPEEVDKWDSLAHLRLITAVEAEYGIRLTMQQIQGIQSLRDLIAVVGPDVGAGGTSGSNSS
jgi:acyl carrier protein